MQLIDKDKLIETIQLIPCWECDGQGTDECYSCIMERVADAPAVDYIPMDAETVLKGVHDQIRWERDMAMESLKEIGVGFCEKTDDVVRVVRCKECKHSLENNGLLVIGARFCHRNIDGNDVYETVWDCDYCSKGERKEVQE